ncbi:MAG: D-2-hydroxyacid dehydrogenase [Bacteroidota bacterium]
MMKIVVLDAAHANPGDLSWEPIDKIGELRIYQRTSSDQLIARALDADVIITNKVVLDKAAFAELPKCQLVCLLATGYNNIDLSAAREHNVTVCNAVGYSTFAVAQHVFALILHLTNHVAQHDNWVQNGMWSQHDWSHVISPISELRDRTLGIYGFGRIGKQVATLAAAFGMNIVAHHRHPMRDAQRGIRFLSLEEVFEVSDIISLHAPLSADNHNIVDASLLNRLKTNAILVNTGRGGLINESDLAEFLHIRSDVQVALDVLAEEPPPGDHPLVGLRNCIITPHVAWAAYEARKKLLEVVHDNIMSFRAGTPINVVS